MPKPAHLRLCLPAHLAERLVILLPRLLGVLGDPVVAYENSKGGAANGHPAVSHILVLVNDGYYSIKRRTNYAEYSQVRLDFEAAAVGHRDRRDHLCLRRRIPGPKRSC